MEYIEPLAELIEGLRRFQGIGAKSAQRMAFQLLDWNKQDIEDFSKVIKNASEQIHFCPDCFNFSVKDSLCNVCNSHKREKSVICVVPTTRELVAIERTGQYKGLYHVLRGLISPLDGISPDDLTIRELLQRIQRDNIEEIILALSPSTEGEATMLYMSRMLKPIISKVTRLSFGLAVGSDIEQTDELTLAKAFDGRLTL